MSISLQRAPARPADAGQGTPPARPRRARSWTRAGWACFAFTVPAWLYVAGFYLYPLASSVRMGFQNYTVASFYTGVAPFVGWGNYQAVIQHSDFGRTMFNTAVFTAGSLLFQFGIGLALAEFFNRRFPLGGVLRSLLLVPWLLPLAVSGTAWRWILDTDSGVLNYALQHLHLIGAPIPWLASTHDSLIAVILVNIWVGIPFNMVILYGGLQGIPGELYEAAALDGAGAWRRFRHLTLPLLRPVTAVVLTLGLIYTVKVFDVIMVLTQGGPAGSSQTLTVFAYNPVLPGAGIRPRGRRRQPAHRGGRGLRGDLPAGHPRAAAGPTMSATTMWPGHRARRTRPVLSTVIGVLILAVLLFPLYWMLNASLLPSSDLVQSSPSWIPLHGSLQGYRNAISSQGGHLAISLLISCGSVLVTLGVAAPAAFGLSLQRAPLGRSLTFALLIAQMIPGIVMANSLYIAANKLGLIDSPWGLILADSTLCIPFAVLILSAFMGSIPRALYEAALVDGPPASASSGR